jgi:hypothetical protein
MRLFELHGPYGAKAEGVEFEDGACAVRWLSRYPSTAAFDGVDDIMAVHTSMDVVWLDEDAEDEDDRLAGVEEQLSNVASLLATVVVNTIPESKEREYLADLHAAGVPVSSPAPITEPCCWLPGYQGLELCTEDCAVEGRCIDNPRQHRPWLD